MARWEHLVSNWNFKKTEISYFLYVTDMEDEARPLGYICFWNVELGAHATDSKRTNMSELGILSMPYILSVVTQARIL